MDFNSTVINEADAFADSGADHQGQPERRAGGRLLTVCRIAHVQTCDDEGLARIVNISDEGLGLQLLIPVMLGDVISARLNADVVIKGRVVWTRGSDCGLQLSDPIDSKALLREIAAQSRSTSHRSMRIPVNKPAVARSEQGLRRIEVQDVSQHGMKIAHDGSFAPGLHVKVSLGSGIERRGVVRWSRDGIAGLILLEPFSVHELGSTKNL